MSLVRSSAVESGANHPSSAPAIAGIDRHKRKLDDYASALDSGDLVYVTMKKHGSDTVNPSMYGSRAVSATVADENLFCSSECSSPGGSKPESTRIQFFVRMISEGKSIVCYADKNDTVLTLHHRIKAMTGIPVFEQRLIYGGKQLQYEQSLADCAVEKDACLNLVGRMRSTGHPLAWQLTDDIISTAHRMCRGEIILDGAQHINERLNAFFGMTPRDKDSAMDYLQIFMASSAPAVLVMLYVSSIKGNQVCADRCIRHFMSACRMALPSSFQNQSALMVLEFCKMLRSVARDQPLYFSCRTTLASMLETAEVAWGLKNENQVAGSILWQEMLPFINELVDKLSKDLTSSSESIMGFSGPWSSDVCDFSAFLLPLRMAILEHVGFSGPIALPLLKERHNHSVFVEEIEYLYGIFKQLLDKVAKSLTLIEVRLGPEACRKSESMHPEWSQYLAILRELHQISKLYQGAEDQLLSVLQPRKAQLCALVIRFAKEIDEHQWILEYKNLTDFEVRKHLVMMLFPGVREDYEELHEMLIDRSHLLAESFEYIGRADSDSLRGSLFMEFKNEEATGPGVLREWFFLVCQAIFDPQNALFVPCPVDRRRFYPNPASKVDPMHLEYFAFSGRVIALALMHKIQVGILFDRVFFLPLAGSQISLEDIRDADPCMYSSCKQILEMDAEFVDSDALGLTFVREVEELGCRKVVELCPGGKSIAVNSKNRGEYINLLIEHRFVISVSEQISYFSRGFADMLSKSKLQKLFFQSLEIEDLDRMLHGSDNAVSVEDWKAHTEYNGYKETDPQIVWFWKIVGNLSAEKRKTLLFFWTSLKFLPAEGFRGLASKLYIYKSYESNHLPSSHTCFYRLCLPQYPTKAVMKERLKVITQDHIGCGFGTW